MRRVHVNFSLRWHNPMHIEIGGDQHGPNNPIDSRTKNKPDDEDEVFREYVRRFGNIIQVVAPLQVWCRLYLTASSNQYSQTEIRRDSVKGSKWNTVHGNSHHSSIE